MNFLTDVRYAARALRGSAGFTAAAVATMAVGIGATAAMFSIVYATLLEPLPFPDSGRLVAVGSVRLDSPGNLRGASLEELRDWQQQSRTIQSFGAWRDWGMSRHDGHDGESVYGIVATPGLFEVLAVMPQLGRVFRPDEDRPGHNTVVLLTDRYWRDRFGADPGILGRTLVLERGPRATYTVVGVLPPEFEALPSFEDVQVVAPSSIDPDAGHGRALRNRRVFARLRQGASIQAARDEMDVIAARLANEYPESNADWGIALRSLIDQEVGAMGGALRGLFAAVGFLLLIACVNIAALQLARALSRRREFAIRQAVGGRRVHLTRAMVMEGLLIAVVGGLAGLLLASWLIDTMLAAGPSLPRARAVEVNVVVLAFSFAVCVASGLAVALPASALATRLDVVRGLKEESGHGATARVRAWRAGFVAMQVGMTLLLLTGAVLASQTFVRLLRLQPGFNPEHVAAIPLMVPIDRKGDEVKRLYSDAVGVLRATPGVTAASAVSAGPLFGGSESLDLHVEPRRTGARAVPARYFNVAPGYFRTLGAPIVRGRDIDEHIDRPGSSAVAIVNETFARRYLPGREPVGARLRLAESGEVVTVVGIAGDLSQDFRPRAEVEPELYFPYSQFPRWATYIVVRVENTLASLPLVAERVQAIDPGLRVGTPLRLEDRIARSARAPRFTLILLSAFSALALLLSAVGVYGLVSYSVAQRTREIGLRVSLGASRLDIVRLLTGTALVAVVAGCLGGAAATLALRRVVASVLPHVEPLGLAAVLSAGVLLALVGALASWLPVRRALQLDPAAALRES